MRDLVWRFRERVRSLLFPARMEKEVEDEIAFHLEMEQRELESGGLDRAEARRRARLRFGGVERVRAEARELRFGHLLEQLLRDLRLGLRRLRRSPGFTVVAVLTLAVGIGASTAIWSLARATLFASLPYDEPERLVVIRTSWTGQDEADASPAELLDYQARLGHVFEHVGGYAFDSVEVATAEGPRRLRAAFVSTGTLESLGVGPVEGRRFTGDEHRQTASAALLSHRAWKARFGGDPEIVGRPLRLSGGAVEIVGVLPPGRPLPESLLLDDPAEIVFPIGIHAGQDPPRGSHFLSTVARLRPGVEPSVARGEVAALGRSFERDFPEDYPVDMGFRLGVEPLSSWVRGPFVRPVGVLLAAVGFLLLVACANVAGLLLARTERRGPALALASVLGAGRLRLVRQLAVESALLALAGGLAGAGLAAAALRGLRFLLPATQARWIAVDARVLGVALGVTAVTALVFGLVPLFQLGGRRLAGVLRTGLRTTAGAVGGQRLRRALTVAQVAVALVLLVCGGLLVESFARLLDVDPGYRVEEVVTAEVGIPSGRYAADEEVVGFLRRVEERFLSLPGARSVGSAFYLVLDRRPGDLNFEIEGRPVPPDRASPAADWQIVTPGYFPTLGIEPEEGRAFGPGDGAESPGVVMVNRSFVERHFPDSPGGDALGRRIHPGGEHTQPKTATIVGVVPDVRQSGLGDEVWPQMYFPHAQFRFWSNAQPARSMAVLVSSPLASSSQGLAEMRRAMTASLSEIDPTLALSEVRTLEEVRAASVAQPRLLAAVLGVFAVATLFLAAVGLYGVVSQSVGRRLPELGVRRALGAAARDLAGEVVGEAARLTLVGLALGALGAIAAARLVRGLLYGVRPAEPAVLLGVVVLLVLAVALACLRPALRAARVDPAELLRVE